MKVHYETYHVEVADYWRAGTYKKKNKERYKRSFIKYKKKIIEVS
jgi:hypothetical protein